MTRSRAGLLALGIVLLLATLSAEFLFQQSFHPVWDSAANALSVERAKRFEQLYGPYSRWGFHHPGPAMFYVQAFGEWLFHDTLHWASSPVAGQTLAHAALMSGFFAAALRMFTRGVPAGRWRWWFVCGALALAIPHFVAMNRIPSYDVLRGPSALMSLWSAHALVLPFLVLLTAGASVASGRGGDLPTLALAGGYLLHLHVAQPMFVLPAFALGYVGLLRQVNLRRGNGGNRPRWLVVRAWRAFPRAHVFAAVVLAVFALPFLLDFCRGADSNTALILKHLERYSTHKPLERAVFYFAMFGAYTAFNPVDNEFAFYDRAGLWGYLQAHAGLLVFWVGVAVVVVGTLLAGLRRWARMRRGQTLTTSPSGENGGADFRAWAAGFCLLAVGLTLRWNVRQDDQMFYFNSWFTFAIYGFGAWIALAAGCGNLRSRLTPPDRRHHPSGPTGGERLAGVCLVLIVVGWHLDGLRWRDPSPAATAAMRADLRRLQEATGATGATPGAEPGAAKMLRFDYPVSPVAAAAALQLARDGVPFFTVNQWAVYLGLEHAWSRVPERTLRSGRLETWRFAHRARVPGSSADDLPITTVPYLREFFQAADDLVVRRSEPPVDPAAADGGAAIRFGPGGDATHYAVGGWFTADDGQIWMDDPRAMLAFQPVPLPITAGDDGGTVEITLTGFTSMVAPPTWPRLQVFLNGEPLGDGGPVPTGARESLTYRVPAAVWNRRAATTVPGGSEPACGQLLVEIPEAISGGDTGLPKPPSQRAPIGLSLREVRFRWVPPGPAPGGS